MGDVLRWYYTGCIALVRAKGDVWAEETLCDRQGMECDIHFQGDVGIITYAGLIDGQ